MIFDNDKNKYTSWEGKEFEKYLIAQYLTWKHHIDHAIFKTSLKY